MANTASIKLIRRPPKADLQFKSIQQEITKQLQVVGKQHVSERKQVTDNFDTEINFGYEVKVSGGQVTLEVSVTNAGEQLPDSDWTVGQLWKALDKTGTKPHIIRPKNPQGTLAFKWGGPGSYQAKTRPVGRFGGSGQVSNGQTVFRKQVNHPGTQPRKFSDAINKRLRKQYEKAVDRGIRLGSRKRR